jgi:predicted TIM-barrel fold metal-dependent hydrolase
VTSDVRKQIAEKVWKTSFVDTHEHLFEETLRLAPETMPFIQCHDWSVLVAGYLYSDLTVAGLPVPKGVDWSKHDFFSPQIDPIEKWSRMQPYWPAVKNTGYGLALRLSLKELYGVDDLSSDTIKMIQDGYQKTVVPGFYRRILTDVAHIESCQVNSPMGVYHESAQPTQLMQDINAAGIIARDAFPNLKGWSSEAIRQPTGLGVNALSGWHEVIDWWFAKYARFAVAVKSQHAYVRGIDHAQVPAEEVEASFKKQLENQPLTSDEQKALEDHLFWYVVQRATENNLPVKLHTGYYAGENTMPLSRLMNNPGSASDLCRAAPDTKFVFLHICYPFYEPMIALAKQYTNAYIDMCFAWICNPIAAKDFLKKCLVTAPANKILTFGADCLTIENVVGHAILARRGITQALSELVEEGWFQLDDALELIEPLMHGNARQLFDLKRKEEVLKQAPWL